jgi:CspA family cold shock protein
MPVTVADLLHEPGRWLECHTRRVVLGIVREWRLEEGWGVIDSAETPDGCWAHFSSINMEGFKALTPGGHVYLVWEPARQDGYSFRAVSVIPASTG